jgi:DNA-binding NtrC family response regulator
MEKSVQLGTARVLIVEDEMLIALDLADIVEAAGGVVIGPVGSVREALLAAVDGAIDAAILDVNLPDGDITPVMDELLRRHVPFLIYTGGGATEAMMARKSDIPILRKPAQPNLIITILSNIMDGPQR